VINESINMTESDESTQPEKVYKMPRTQFNEAEAYPSAGTWETGEPAKSAASSASRSDDTAKKKGIEEVEVQSKDLLLLRDGIDFHEDKIRVRAENLERVLSEEVIKQCFYSGGLVACEWTVGHHDEDLAVSLISDEFTLLFDIPPCLGFGAEEAVATRDLNDEGLSFRTMKQIEEQSKLLRKYLDVFAARRLDDPVCLKALRVAGAFNALELILSGEIGV
jgi:hypothetical protein